MRRDSVQRTVGVKFFRMAAAFVVAAMMPVTMGRAAPEAAVAGDETDVNPATIVQTQLLANVTAVQNGEPIMLGVHFKIAPDWHIYWTNPGESGLDTKVEVVDFTTGHVGPVQYPAPIKFESPGPLVSYGYADEVMLLVPVTPVFTGADPKEVTLKTKARWLMCKDRCIPGKTELSITLPVGKPQPANTEMFERFRAAVPVTAQPKYVSGSAKVTDKEYLAEFRVTPPEGSVVIAGGGKGLAPVFFFPQRAEGFEPGVPVLPAPDTTVKTPAGEVPAYSKPFVIQVKGTVSAGAPPEMRGVLTMQTAPRDGGVGKVEHAEIVVKP